jgi:hypothetical protein
MLHLILAAAAVGPWCGFHPLRAGESCGYFEGESRLSGDVLVVTSRSGDMRTFGADGCAVYREGRMDEELVAPGGAVFHGRRVRVCLGVDARVTYVVILRRGP